MKTLSLVSLLATGILMIAQASFASGESALLENSEMHAVKDGAVPRAFLSQAKAYAGTYEGRMHQTGLIQRKSVRGALRLNFDGNAPSAEFASKSGMSLLGENCETKIGRLIGYTLSENQKYLDSLTFDFDSGNCGGVADNVKFELTGKNVVEASMVVGNECATAPNYDCNVTRIGAFDRK